MLKKKKNSLSAGIVVNLVATFLLRAIGIITAPITTRLLTTSDYGEMSIYSTWVGISMIVFGMQVFGTITNAQIKYENRDIFFNYCWNALLLSLFGHIVGLILILPWIETLSSLIKIVPALICLIIAQSFFGNAVDMLSGYLIIQNRAGLNMILSSIISLGSFGLSVLLVKLDVFPNKAYLSYIIGHFSVVFVCGMAVIIWLFSKGACRIKNEYIHYCLGLSLPLIFHGLSGIVLGQSDRLMLENMANVSEAGVYSLTYNFSNILLMIWSAINAIWVPFYFRYLKAGDYNELHRHTKNFDILFIVLFSGFLLLSPEVFQIMDSRYWDQMNIIPVLITGFYFNHLYGYPANYEFYKEKTKYIAIASVGAAIINILLNYLLIPRYYAKGAAIATALSFVIIYLFHAIAARCFVKGFPFSIMQDVIRLIPVGFVLAIFYILKDLVMYRWILAIVVGIIYLIRLAKKKEIL